MKRTTYVHMKSQPKNEKSANAVWERVRLMSERLLPVRGSKGMEWKYDDEPCVCVCDKRNRDPCSF